jgi:hypothetical protein
MHRLSFPRCGCSFATSLPPIFLTIALVLTEGSRPTIALATKHKSAIGNAGDEQTWARWVPLRLK